MTKSIRALLIGAVLTGLTSGANIAAMAQTTSDPDKTQNTDSGKKAGKDAKVDKHSCKGKNSCKGKGGCRTDGKKPQEGDHK